MNHLEFKEMARTSKIFFDRECKIFTSFISSFVINLNIVISWWFGITVDLIVRNNKIRNLEHFFNFE